MTTSAPYSNSTTSKAAAQTLSQRKVVRDRRSIAEFIANRGAAGAADFELSAALPDIHDNALRARRGDLEAYERRAITSSEGERRENPETGKFCAVYHITERGLRALGRDPAVCFFVPVQDAEVRS